MNDVRTAEYKPAYGLRISVIESIRTDEQNENEQILGRHPSRPSKFGYVIRRGSWLLAHKVTRVRSRYP